VKKQFDQFVKNWGYHMYKQRQTREARNDLKNLTAYMMYTLKNVQTAISFMKRYKKEIANLLLFPYAYRDIGYTYQGYAIRMKPFSTYNIFYVVDETTHQITILRILKNRQDWKYIMYGAEDFSI